MFLGFAYIAFAVCCSYSDLPENQESTIIEDKDGDGFSPESGDCDDTDDTINPNFPDTIIDGIDQNCDGIDGPDADGDGYIAVDGGGSDCDDTDPNSTTTAEDPDCDGFPAAIDCDDEDPNSHTIYEDSDCDGFIDQPCYSLSFDGDGDVMTTNSSFSLQDFTIEFWMKLPTLIDHQRIIFDTRDTNEDWRLTMMITEDCQVRAEIRPSGSYTRHLTNSESSCNGTWNHVALIREGNQIRLFVLGREIANHSFPEGVLSLSTPLTFGTTTIPDERYQYFQGLIFSVHISAAVQYTEDFIPSQRIADETTRALWFLGEGQGDIVSTEDGEFTGYLNGVEWAEDCPYEYR